MRAAALFLLLLVGLAAPLTGQQLQPGLEVRVTGVLDAGRLLVRNGGRDFVRTLADRPAAAELRACRPVIAAGQAAPVPEPAPSMAERTAPSAAAPAAADPAAQAAFGPRVDAASAAQPQPQPRAEPAAAAADPPPRRNPVLTPEEAAEILAGMSDLAWQQLVREVLAGSNCRIAVEGGESRVVALAAQALGIAPDQAQRLTGTLFIRAEIAIDRLVAAGEVRVTEDALVLIGCP